VVGPAEEPPPGPFDAVIERHMIWTSPDPVRALRAWREVAPQGRLALFEGEWGGSGPGRQVRDAAVEVLRRIYRIPPEHHAPYDPRLLAELPLARLTAPQPLIDAVREAGWRAVRLSRLRDVEWARRTVGPPLLGWLESVPRYAIVADA